MKRYGEKAVKEAIAKGAIIRDYDWYTGIGSPRIIIDEEPVGYIVSDLLWKLIREGYVERSRNEYSFREYKASAETVAAEIAANPYGIAACKESLEFYRDTCHYDAARIAANLLHSQAANGCFFNRRMWDAFDSMFPDFPVSYDVLRELWAAASASEENDWEAMEHAARSIRAYAETIAQEAAQVEQPAPAEAAQEATSAAQEPAQPTSYLRADFDEATHSAKVALGWHRAGDDILVCRYGEEPVYVHGAPQEAPRSQEDENRAHCRHIAKEVEAYADGLVYRCPDCGEELRLPDDVGDKYRCPGCGAVNDVDDLEQLSLWDFLADVYDVEYRVGSDKEYRSVRVMVACGGPNIYIDTASAMVKLYWWTEYAEYPLSYDARDAIDEWAEEYWNM